MMRKLTLLLSFLIFQSLLIAQSPGDSMMVGDIPDPEQIQAQLLMKFWLYLLIMLVAQTL